MSFESASVTERAQVLDTASKLGTLSRLLVMGGTPMTEEVLSMIDSACTQAVAALAQAGYSGLPAGTGTVTDGDTVTVKTSGAGTTTAPGTATVTGTTLTDVKLVTGTDAIVQHDQDISVQARDGTVLLGAGVKARVAEGVLTAAYFPSPTQSAVTDGTPKDVTTARGGSVVTGKVRMYISGNQLKNVYLDGTAAVQSGVTVPVQNSIGQNIQPGTVTVSNNQVSSVKLPANYTAFGDGIDHKVTDGTGKTAQATARVSGGVLTDQTLVDTVALVSDGQVLPVQGGTVTLAIAKGVITATYAPAA